MRNRLSVGVEIRASQSAQIENDAFVIGGFSAFGHDQNRQRWRGQL